MFCLFSTFFLFFAFHFLFLCAKSINSSSFSLISLFIFENRNKIDFFFSIPLIHLVEFPHLKKGDTSIKAKILSQGYTTSFHLG